MSNCAKCGIRILGSPVICSNCGAKTGLSNPLPGQKTGKTRSRLTHKKKAKKKTAVTKQERANDNVGEFSELLNAVNQLSNAVDVYSRICNY
jgi:hypothetical protein